MNKFIIRAFTLIELLVVIAIIGILSGLIVVSMSGVTQKANIAKAQVFSNSLRNSLMANLISEWKFDEINVPLAGKTPDSWSGNNSGTLGSATGADTNDPAWITSGCVSGNCLSFDGSDDYVNCGTGDNLNLTTSFVINAWIYKPSFKGNYEQVVAKTTSGGTGGYEFGIQNNRTIYITNGPDTKWGNTVLLANTWYYITVSFNGANVHFYLNGVSDSNNLAITFPSSTSSAGIGRAPDRAGLQFIGLIDDVRIYNVAIPTSQIKEQYYAGLNNLLASGGITQEEYRERINSLAISK
ncbi:MAG: LamG-like jellyroll fold domain-containing protein [Candidatus Paceibacterota bacterium]